MKCKSIQPLLMEYLTKELDHEQKTQVQQHLHSCKACQSVVESYDYFNKEARQWVDEPVPSWPSHQTFAFRSAKPFNIWAYVNTSMLLLICSLLFFNTHIQVQDELMVVSFGGQSRTQIVEKKFIEEKLNQLEQRQLSLIKASMAKLKIDQNKESERLVKVLLDYVERDRLRDLNQLVDYMDSQRQMDKSQIDLAVNYLLRSQIKDEQELGTLNQLIRYNRSQIGEDE